MFLSVWQRDGLSCKMDISKLNIKVVIGRKKQSPDFYAKDSVVTLHDHFFFPEPQLLGYGSTFYSISTLKFLGDETIHLGHSQKDYLSVQVIVFVCFRFHSYVLILKEAFMWK